MRISELAQRTGVSIATIKYYVREGLLPPGRVTSRTQAQYDEVHVRRLRLLRILREIGHVPVGRLRDLVDTVEAEGLTTHAVLERAADALAPVPPPAGPAREAARKIADELVDAAGWTRVRPHAPDRENLAAAIEAVIAFGTHDHSWPDLVRPYVDAVDVLARGEIANLDPGPGPDAVMQEMVIGQVVFGEILATLRRLAEEHYSAERFAPVEG